MAYWSQAYTQKNILNGWNYPPSAGAYVMSLLWVTIECDGYQHPDHVGVAVTQSAVILTLKGVADLFIVYTNAIHTNPH